MNIFKETINIIRPQSSKFDLSHENKLSLDMGTLVPVLTQEVLPGDKWKCDTEILLRFAPMLAPIYHQIEVYTHSFFVPNRIIWTEWEDFIGGGPQGTLAPLHPTVQTNATTAIIGQLADYMGVPTEPNPPPSTVNYPILNALPFRAYQQVYNDYYRDQNLENEYAFSKLSGFDATQNVFQLQTRAWEKDYFTSALPWAQRGAPQGAPVTPISPGSSLVKTGANNTNAPDGALQSTGGVLFQGTTGVRVETAGSVLINDLRKANVLQEWLEKTARSGARLKELVLQHFGISNNDGRLQRAEYLGGGRHPVVISEVLSTFDNTAGGKPQGQFTGHGIAVGQNHGFSREFTEHGWVLTIMSVIPKTNYFQGIPKQFMKTDKFSYAWPSFADLGEQEVKQSELLYDYDTTNASRNDLTFGYQSRYADYKYIQSNIHGDFRESLQYWHMARRFDPALPPALNNGFVKCIPTKDIFAVNQPLVPSLYAQVFHVISAIRPLPYLANPKL